MDERASVEATIDERDKKFLGPTERAEAIWNLLRKEHPMLTSWDLTCFAAYWLVVVSAEFAWLKPVAKEAAKLITFSHYHMNEEGLASSLTRDGIEPFKPSDEPTKPPDATT